MKPYLPDSLHTANSTIENFLKSSEKMLIVTGKIGTGLELLLDHIKELLAEEKFSILAPNSRIASRYEANSIYGYIYSGNPKLEKDKLIYKAKENKDFEQQIYIVVDAHLISDSLFETDNTCYGSGKLLSDFIDFINLKNSERKIIFLGDLFQLMRGKFEESALCYELLQAKSGFQVIESSINSILPEKESDLFVKNASKLAESMKAKIFNQMDIIADDKKVIKFPADKTLKIKLLEDLFIQHAEDTKFVAFSHSSVNKFNSWIRKNVFERSDAICAGDIVHIHNRFFIKKDDDLENSISVPNDSFAEVIEVNEDIVIEQPLKGRDSPVIIPFLKVRAKLLDNSKEVEFPCLKEYLYTEKPVTDIETCLALRVDAEKRWKSQKEYFDLDLANFLKYDSYFNAARLRFGYALTLHRAQGLQFDTVIANMETKQGKENDAYFRWIYTLFSVAQEKLILSNIPKITLLNSKKNEAKWDERQAKIDSVRFVNVGNFDFPIKFQETIYHLMKEKLELYNISIKGIEHHKNHEHYYLQLENDKLKMQVDYKDNGFLTRFAPLKYTDKKILQAVRLAIGL